MKIFKFFNFYGNFHRQFKNSYEDYGNFDQIVNELT